MMNSRDIVDEIIKRKDIYIKNRNKKIKKALTVMSVVLLFTVIGGASVMIGVQRKDTPTKPPKVTLCTGDTTEEKETGTTETTDSSSESINGESSEDKSEVSDTESEVPTEESSEVQTSEPTEIPTEEPTEIPTPEITEEPTEVPTEPKPTEPKPTEPKPTEPEPTEPEPTEPKPTEPEPTEPEPTEPEPTDPPVTDSCESFPPVTDPTEGLVQIGKLESKPFYPKVNPDYYYPPSGGGMSFDSFEGGDPTVEYQLGYEGLFYGNGEPVKYSFFADDYYFITSDNMPTTVTNYSILGKFLQDEKLCVERLVKEYYGLESKYAIDRIYSGSYIPQNDAYGTEFIVNFKQQGEIGGINTFMTRAYVTLKDTETHRRCDFTYDEIYEYITSLPHFRALLAYSGIDEFTVERKYERYSDDRYHYEFIFIPKTDDYSTACLYRETKYVMVTGDIVPPGTAEPSKANVNFCAADLPWEVYKTIDLRTFEEAFEDVAAKFEEFGVREYFEKNFVCVMDYERTDLQFYLKFLDENGEIVYCEMRKYGYTSNGKPGAFGPLGLASVRKR